MILMSEYFFALSKTRIFAVIHGYLKDFEEGMS